MIRTCDLDQGRGIQPSCDSRKSEPIKARALVWGGGLDRSREVDKHTPRPDDRVPRPSTTVMIRRKKCIQTNKAQMSPRSNGQRTHFHVTQIKIHPLIVIKYTGYMSVVPICLTGICQNDKLKYAQQSIRIRSIRFHFRPVVA